MKKTISLVATLCLSFSAVGSVLASGWRIPEQSVDSTGKAGANIASAHRADTAYYNPAKMNWLDNSWQVETDMTYIHLTAVEYNDARKDMFDHESEKEHFFVPTGYMVSPDFSGFRFGLAVVAPYGLAKRWKDGYGQAFVKEFGLKVIEINPTVSYTFGEMVSVAAGPRVLWAEGIVESDASVIGRDVGRRIKTRQTEIGWNAAVNIRPTEGLDLAVTYRSYVDLYFEGGTFLNLAGTALRPDAELSIPAPAVFAVSVAYDLYEDFNIELTWDRTFWSEYDSFDINFTPLIPGNPFEKPAIRNWDDTDAFRLGLTYQVNENLEILAGLGYDKSPVPTETLDFSVPDANAWLYSLGMQYRVNKNLEVGLSALYDRKEKRQRQSNLTDSIYGSYNNAAAWLITAGVNYTF